MQNDDFAFLDSDFEKALYLQNLLVGQATGEGALDEEYSDLRGHFMRNPALKPLLPEFVRRCRSLDQFWGYIQPKLSTYKERRTHIYDEFAHLLDELETQESSPSDQSITDALTRFDETEIQAVWAKALERRNSDPEGAITAARTLLETVCKHILDAAGVEYEEHKVDLPGLYKMTAATLNLAPTQHTEQVFKQILGGCTAVVEGLGTLRNRLSDAHGRGKNNPVKPASRHAELAVNLSGSLALFLIETWNAMAE